jgi:tRNA (guanine-N7-)-methyltransferase
MLYWKNSLEFILGPVMRPEDLKSTFTWATRAPLLQDKILYVPEYYFKHEEFQMPALSQVFGNNHPLAIEYCTGHGDWIIEKAKQNPQVNWIAVEKQFERVRKIFSKRENNKVTNVLIVCGEAQTFTRYYLSSQSIKEIYINFPDPWPKHRHAKHRLIQKEFIEEMTRIVVVGGKMTCVTDDAPYCQSVIKLMQQSGLWNNLHPEPYFLTNITGYGYSFFESLWKNLGRTIFHTEFVHLLKSPLCLPTPTF